MRFNLCISIMVFFVNWRAPVMDSLYEEWWWKFNSLDPGRLGFNFKLVFFKILAGTDISSISCEIAPTRMPQDLSDDISTLVQVMAWYHQTTSITWANVHPDLCRHMASLSHKSLLAEKIRSAHWLQMPRHQATSNPADESTYEFLLSHGSSPSLVQVIAWCLFGANQLP